MTDLQSQDGSEIFMGSERGSGSHDSNESVVPSQQTQEKTPKECIIEISRAHQKLVYERAVGTLRRQKEYSEKGRKEVEEYVKKYEAAKRHLADVNEQVQTETAEIVFSEEKSKEEEVASKTHNTQMISIVEEINQLVDKIQQQKENFGENKNFIKSVADRHQKAVDNINKTMASSDDFSMSDWKKVTATFGIDAKEKLGGFEQRMKLLMDSVNKRFEIIGNLEETLAKERNDCTIRAEEIANLEAQHKDKEKKRELLHDQVAFERGKAKERGEQLRTLIKNNEAELEQVRVRNDGRREAIRLLELEFHEMERSEKRNETKAKKGHEEALVNKGVSHESEYPSNEQKNEVAELQGGYSCPNQNENGGFSEADKGKSVHCQSSLPMPTMFTGKIFIPTSSSADINVSLSASAAIPKSSIMSRKEKVDYSQLCGPITPEEPKSPSVAAKTPKANTRKSARTAKK